MIIIIKTRGLRDKKEASTYIATHLANCYSSYVSWEYLFWYVCSYVCRHNYKQYIYAPAKVKELKFVCILENMFHSHVDVAI